MIKNTNEIRIPMFDISVIEHGEKMIDYLTTRSNLIIGIGFPDIRLHVP